MISIKSKTILILTLFAVLIVGCAQTQTVEFGDLIKVDYTGTLEDGTKFDSSIDRGIPLQFTAGVGQMIPGFDQAVLGMKVGEEKTITLPPEEAYGQPDPTLFIKIPREEVPQNEQLEIGREVVLSGPNGQQVKAVVSDLSEEEATFDLNHELAGKTLIFEIKVVEISKP